jgi:hypothetical protein
MSNVFASLPVPASPGVGAAVDVSLIGPEKSFVLEGPGGVTAPTGAYGRLSIEVSEDGINFSPFLTIDRLGDPGFSSFIVVCYYMRVRRLAGFGGAGASVTVGGESTSSNMFGPLVVPVGGTGPGYDTSAFGGQKTVVVSGVYDGNLVVEGSVNGGATYDPIITCNTGNSDTFVIAGVWQMMRVRRLGQTFGMPTVTVGGHPLSPAGASAPNTCIFKWSGRVYIPAPNGSVPDPYVCYFTDDASSTSASPIYYTVPVVGVLSLLNVRVLYNDADGITTIMTLNGIIPTTQSISIPASTTGTFTCGAAGAAFALNNQLELAASVAGDSGGHVIIISATCLYTIS